MNDFQLGACVERPIVDKLLAVVTTALPLLVMIVVAVYLWRFYRSMRG